MEEPLLMGALYSYISIFPVGLPHRYTHSQVAVIIFAFYSPIIICQDLLQYLDFSRFLLILILLGTLFFTPSYLLYMLSFNLLISSSSGGLVWLPENLRFSRAYTPHVHQKKKTPHSVLCRRLVFSTMGQLAVLYPGNRSPTFQCTHRRWLDDMIGP